MTMHSSRETLSTAVWNGLTTAIRDTRASTETVNLETGTRIIEDLGVTSYEMLNIIFILEEQFDTEFLRRLSRNSNTLGNILEEIVDIILQEKECAA